MATLPMPKKKLPPKKVLPMPWPKLTGRAEKNGPYAGMLLVPYADRPKHPQFPAIRKHDLRERTVYVVDTAAKKVVHLATTVSITPTTTTPIGWSTCHECHQWFTHCRCMNGMTLPGAVTHTPTDTRTVMNHGIREPEPEPTPKPKRLPLPKKRAAK